ncbi:MAG TPA: hypothetical protein VER55_03290, partial [Ardenticatenaceae bacterium]|nr:hypothetical protein [Ardenticatenaceae bacterium]
MAVYSVIILADTMERATQLGAMDLDLHTRAARRRPDTGQIAVPAILDDAEIQRVRAAGYVIEIQQD